MTDYKEEEGAKRKNNIGRQHDVEDEMTF